MSDRSIPSTHKRRFPIYYALFIFVPASLISQLALGESLTTFVLSVLALIPASIAIGRATEQLALRHGSLVGGLLNASFGNATELIVALYGLKQGLLPMVRASITGSILGNLLLVMGMGALAGGIRHKEQEFGKPTGSLMSTLMLLAVIGLVVPAVFAGGLTTKPWSPGRMFSLSFAVAIVLLIVYVLGLLFSLKTHQSLFMQETDDDEPPPQWSTATAITVILISTCLVCMESEFVVGSVLITAHALGLTQVFIGVIIIAIAGNAAEHASAVWMAIKDRMDVCVNIAIGSSAQIALFVAPLLVLCSTGMAHRLDFDFTPFELVAIIFGVAIAHFVSLDGKTNWFEGVELLAVYAILAAAFYYLPQ